MKYPQVKLLVIGGRNIGRQLRESIARYGEAAVLVAIETAKGTARTYLEILEAERSFVRLADATDTATASLLALERAVEESSDDRPRDAYRFLRSFRPDPSVMARLPTRPPRGNLARFDSARRVRSISHERQRPRVLPWRNA